MAANQENPPTPFCKGGKTRNNAISLLSFLG